MALVSANWEGRNAALSASSHRFSAFLHDLFRKPVPIPDLIGWEPVSGKDHAQAKRRLPRRLLRLVFLALAVRDLDQRLGRLAILLQEGGESGRRGWRRHHRLLIQELDEFRIAENFDELGIDLVDDRRRRALRRGKSPPTLARVGTEADLRKGGHVRQQR